MPSLILMDTAINLNDEASSMAIEVDDEAVNDLLPSKSKTSESASTNRGPQSPLSRGHPSPKLARQIDLLTGDELPGDGAA